MAARRLRLVVAVLLACMPSCGDSSSETAETIPPLSITREPALDPTAADWHALTLSTTTTGRPQTPRVSRGGPRTVRGDADASGDLLDRLAHCESGRQNLNTGNGFEGYFQFRPSTWRGLGLPGRPTDHDYATQKEAAAMLIARSGWGQFPGCARRLGVL